MPTQTLRRKSRLVPLRRASVVCATALLIASTAPTGRATTTSPAAVPAGGARTVSFHGYQVVVPRQWKVVDFTARPHACLRFDQPSLYLGHAGDQGACPAHLIGGAPGLQVEVLDARSAAQATRSTLTASRTGEVLPAQLPSRGPVRIAVQEAGVLVTAVYGAASAATVTAVLAGGRVLAGSHRTAPRSVAAPAAPPRPVTTPGRFTGPGFDACTAPSQSAMDAWRALSAYRAVGVYIGGVSRGCGQPNLTAAWVSQQARSGWRMIPTYVGLQAPCTTFYNRMSSDPQSARAQGRAEARDAIAHASALGIGVASTLYSDIEGYNTSIRSCVTAVLGYVSGWTRVLHAGGYQAGVYSSGSSGISDMSAQYTAATFNRPDYIWLAWWNNAADVNGGSYVGATQWSNHQRIHQFAGPASESYGGYRINIDRDFLDVGSPAASPCPTQLNFAGYPTLRSGDTAGQVLAAQCLLIKRGFDPGAVTGAVGPSTAAAIAAFKSSVGLANRAVLGRHGWAALLSAGRTPFLQLGSTGRGVRKLQRSLTASLGQPVAISGVFDRSTRRAVTAFQTAHGLTVDGRIGSRTWAALQTGL